MFLLTPTSVAATAAVTATGLAAASYLDAKYGLSADLRYLWKLKRNEREYARCVREDKVNIWYIFAATCTRHRDREAIWTRERSYSYGEIFDRSLQWANWMVENGVRPGDLVGVYMLNSADFLAIWMGMLCVGAAPAHLNYNLEGEALLHCLEVAQTRLLIVDEDEGCRRRVEESRERIEAKGTKIVVDDVELQAVLDQMPVVDPGRKYRDGTKGEFPYTLIYTSGTTGLPKGCAFTQSRLRLLGAHLEPGFNSQPGVDKWYTPMPLYHGTGSITTSSMLISGISVAIVPRFSVTRFWDDIHDSGATAFIYVGETARYLLNAPPHPLERAHNLRIAYGNGLRPDVWLRFQERFNIPEVAEFFNSTEGIFGMINWCRGEYLRNCVGRHGLVWRQLLKNVYIPVRIDHDTGDIWRDPSTGFAERLPYSTGGEMLVAVPSKQAFQGYWRSEAATDKKFAQNVFKQGDLYYRTGDALRRDDDGKWYFMDRLGDTFRWKSENVSTAEVSLVMGQCPGVQEANVYGVLVPNHEGRAGCAAVLVDQGAYSSVEDYSVLLSHMRERLPRYAVPVFIRVVKASTHIHNHKQNKVPLRKEGVDPRLVGTEAVEGKDDVILWLPPKGEGYVLFGGEDWESLKGGQARL